MKKIFSVLIVLIFSFVSVFAYSPTSKDKALLDMVYEKVDSMEDNARLEKIAKKIDSIKDSFKYRERIYYILDSLQSYIEDKLDDELGGVLEDVFNDSVGSVKGEVGNDSETSTLRCEKLPEATGEIITVSTMAELRTAVNNANNGGNVTILLEDGTYNLDNILFVTADNVTFRSKSGNREKVILKGKGMNGGIMHVFLVQGSDFTVADLTLGWVANHGIQIQGEHDADRPLIHNVHIVDTGEQMIKGSYSKDNNVYSDDGVVECSLMEYSAGIGPQYYIGGIDIHRGVDWIVQDNTFRDIRSPENRWAEHAIHFWSASSGTIVQRNRIINCDRGIGFGLGDSPHTGGIIRNNLIYHNTNRGDVGIGLENAYGTKVYNNTIYQEHSYANAIEYRFEGTMNVKIINNLTNKVIRQRDGANATLENNITNAASSWFENINQYDFNLTSNAGAAKNMAKELDEVWDNINGEIREDGGNIGAF